MIEPASTLDMDDDTRGRMITRCVAYMTQRKIPIRDTRAVTRLLASNAGRIDGATNVKVRSYLTLKLLQSYVENIYHQTDRLSSDATTKETMIQVLIIELILGRHASHKIYDNSLNQALLYRLVSLMNVSDPNKTL